MPIDTLDTRSDEMQELISRTPYWLVRWGITVFFFILVMLGIICWFVKYPDVIKAPLIMTATETLKSVNPKVAGKLMKLFVKEGDWVKEGNVLAYLESTANPEEIVQLDKQLKGVQSLVNEGKVDELPNLSATTYNHLGELQTAYQTFNQSYIQLQSSLLDGYFAQKKAMLQREFKDLTTLAEQTKSQENLYQHDYHLAEKEFSIQQQLAKKGVLSALELNREESKLLTKQMPLKQSEQALVNNNTQQSGKQKEILDLDKQSFELKNNFVQSFNTLISAIETWKTNYIITAPTSGRVSFSTILQEKTLLSANQEIFFIAPSSSHYFGTVKIPQMNFGKISHGQKVLIKFNGYPFQEFGSVDGVIAEISEVPAKDSSFLAKIHLPNGLETNYHKKLTYKTGMNATAEIITADTRLIERFFHNFKKAVAR